MRTIKARLMAALIALSAALLAVAVAGWLALGAAHDGMRSVYDDRVVPMRDLKAISDLYAVRIVDTAHKVRAGTVPWAEGAESVEAALGGVAGLWSGYRSTYMSPEERRIADEADRLRLAAGAAAGTLLRLMRDRDAAGLQAFVEAELYAAIDPFSEVVARLVDLQLREAEAQYRRTGAAYDASRLAMAVLSLAGLAAAAFALWVTVALTVRPLAAIAALMERLARGELDIAVAGEGRRDEIGVLARALAVFKDAAVAARRLEAEQRLERERKEARRLHLEGEIAAFDGAVRASLEALAGAAAELDATAGGMSATAERTSRQAVAVSAAAGQTTVNVQAVAGATEELTVSISEIGRQVAKSSAIAGQAVEEAARTDHTVAGLAEAAGRIGEVVDLIGAIAGQTNLLALNATIEAARAGEAGKGFAVVASEVKTLANQTAKATEDISAQIAAMQRVTERTVEAIKGIGRTIGGIDEITTTIASAVEEQGAATREIARNVQQAAAGTTDVSANIAQVNRAAEDTGAAAARVLSSAGGLGRQAATLRAEIDRFLLGIREA
ncbi:MAG TPA: methyl-accepting chemotaxis protein [Alphaproteobacteria bacterium]|nr:methyl-accepting chemotaxis protein [Alphaproteobacteria bacterium]